MMPLLFGDFFNFVLEFLLFGVSGFMILLVLVQRGRGGGLTGALGGMGGQSAFGAKAGDVFTRITVFSAIIWIFLCLVTIMNYTYVPVDNSSVGEYNYENLLGGKTEPDLGTNPDDGPGATFTGTDPEKEGTDGAKGEAKGPDDLKTVDPKAVDPKAVGENPDKNAADLTEDTNKVQPKSKADPPEDVEKKKTPGEGQKPDAKSPKSGQTDGKSGDQQKSDAKVEPKK